MLQCSSPRRPVRSHRRTAEHSGTELSSAPAAGAARRSAQPSAPQPAASRRCSSTVRRKTHRTHIFAQNIYKWQWQWKLQRGQKGTALPSSKVPKVPNTACSDLLHFAGHRRELLTVTLQFSTCFRYQWKPAASSTPVVAAIATVPVAGPACDGQSDTLFQVVCDLLALNRRAKILKRGDLRFRQCFAPAERQEYQRWPALPAL